LDFFAFSLYRISQARIYSSCQAGIVQGVVVQISYLPVDMVPVLVVQRAQRLIINKSSIETRGVTFSTLIQLAKAVLELGLQ